MDPEISISHLLITAWKSSAFCTWWHGPQQCIDRLPHLPTPQHPPLYSLPASLTQPHVDNSSRRQVLCTVGDVIHPITWQWSHMIWPSYWLRKSCCYIITHLRKLEKAATVAFMEMPMSASAKLKTRKLLGVLSSLTLRKATTVTALRKKPSRPFGRNRNKQCKAWTEAAGYATMNGGQRARRDISGWEYITSLPFLCLHTTRGPLAVVV